MTDLLSHGQDSHQGPAQISPSLLHGNHHNCSCRDLRHTKRYLISIVWFSLSRSLSLSFFTNHWNSYLCSFTLINPHHQHHHLIYVSGCSIKRRSTVCIHRTRNCSINNFECTRCSNLRYEWALERGFLHFEWVIISAVQELSGLREIRRWCM